MNKEQDISEEQLNAFVDGELESEERSALFDEAERSVELDQRLCQQRKLKELVQHAYKEVPEPRRLLSGRGPRTSLIGMATAASLLLLVGAISGLFMHGFVSPSPHAGEQAASTDTRAVAAMQKYILHVSSGETEQMKLALQKAQELLSGSEPDNPGQVEIVANERGLDLLRSDITPFSTEIRELANNNVVFYACSKAIQRLEENGIEVKLVPEANAGYTALDRVVIRMKDGWQYIKI